MPRITPAAIILLLICSLLLSACGPSEAEVAATAMAQETSIAAVIYATQTANAPTITPTFTITPSPTVTSTPTRKPTITLWPTRTGTATTTPVPMADGWKEHVGGKIHLALPGHWQSANVDKDGFMTAVRLVQAVDVEYADGVEELLRTNINSDVDLWAFDPTATGSYYPDLTVNYEANEESEGAQQSCDELKLLFKTFGFTVVADDCDLEINGMEAFRVAVRLTTDSFAVKQYYYQYFKDGKSWLLVMTVDEFDWNEYRPTLEQIGDSFSVDQRK